MGQNESTVPQPSRFPSQVDQPAIIFTASATQSSSLPQDAFALLSNPVKTYVLYYILSQRKKKVQYLLKLCSYHLGVQSTHVYDGRRIAKTVDLLRSEMFAYTVLRG